MKCGLTTTPGTICPTLCDKCVGSFTSHMIVWTVKGCETGPTVYSPYPRRLESLTICGCNYKGSTFSSVILRPWVLVRPESNSRPPAWQSDAQPTEPPERFFFWTNHLGQAKSWMLMRFYTITCHERTINDVNRINDTTEKWNVVKKAIYGILTQGTQSANNCHTFANTPFTVIVSKATTSLFSACFTVPFYW